MATPLSRSNPMWLAKQDPNDPELPYNYRRSVRYYRALYQAWPVWCADHPGFKSAYGWARRRRRCGEDVHVDHIIPICSDEVCGLHVPWNLTVIGARENMQKSNRYWPDSWHEQIPLPLIYPTHYQRELPL